MLWLCLVCCCSRVCLVVILLLLVVPTSPSTPLYCISSLFTYSFHVVLFASWFGFGLCFCFCSCSMCGKLLFSLSHLVACSPSRSGQVSSRCCACCFFMSHAGCFSCRRHLPQVAHFVHQVKPLMSHLPLPMPINLPPVPGTTTSTTSSCSSQLPSVNSKLNCFVISSKNCVKSVECAVQCDWKGTNRCEYTLSSLSNGSTLKHSGNTLLRDSI